MSEPIKCNLLPISHQEYVVVPVSAIAEVITEQQELLVMGARDGLIGKLQWRGLSVPLVSFEAAIGKAVPSYKEGVRIVILSSVSGNDATPYIALMVQGMSRLIHLKPDDIKAYDNPEENAFIHSHVDYMGNSTYIPNMEYLEEFVRRKMS